MDQLCAEVGALKHPIKLQADVFEQFKTNAFEVNQRVTALECQFEVLTEPITLNAQGPETASHFPCGSTQRTGRGVELKVAHVEGREPELWLVQRLGQAQCQRFVRRYCYVVKIGL